MIRLNLLKHRYVSFFIGTLFFTLILSGCTTPKNVTYFQDVSEEVIIPGNQKEIRIEPNDKLSIVVKTMDPALTSMFNLFVANDRIEEGMSLKTGLGTLKGNSNAGTIGMSKYTVNQEGYIDFPVLGELKVAGMTRSELAGFIKGEIMGRNLAKDPVVTVEFVNLGVSIIGEVLTPGRYDINQDQINILEAISMAGDLTINGQRENVVVLRETNGEQRTYKVDLTNFKELTQSPVYYLKQGDIIYVEPNDMKKRQATVNGNNVYSTSFWISVASLLTSVVTTITIFIR